MFYREECEERAKKRKGIQVQSSKLHQQNQSGSGYRTPVKLQRHASTISTRGLVFGRQGNRSEAEKAIAELRKLSETQYVSPFEFALAYSSLGDNDQTFFWLDKAFADRSENLGFIRTLPDLNSIHSDPRYAELLRRIGFTQ